MTSIKCEYMVSSQQVGKKVTESSAQIIPQKHQCDKESASSIG